jgi:hypothetical protein
MTNVVADPKCDVCGGLLVPHPVASDVTGWPGMEYVCVTCRRGYRWAGTPPKLTLVSLDERRDDIGD